MKFQWGDKSGDWTCSCGRKLFASKTFCISCDKYKPKPLKNVTKSNVALSQKTNEGVDKILPLRWNDGDWQCQCGELNFRKRTECRKCQLSKILKEDGLCVVCLAEKSNYAPKGCGHLCLCKICVTNLDKCPICREGFDPKKDSIKIFKV